MIFFDSNVLLYSVDLRAREAAKRAHAIELRDRYFVPGGQAVISTQVMQEFIGAGVKRLKLDAATLATSLTSFASSAAIVQVSPPIIYEAIDIMRADKISWWDALIPGAARAGGCSEVWSEDLNEEQVYANGLKVVNPFRDMA